jgi:hypothetical protein
MARKCFMCGSDLATGIVCEKCDKPRKKSSAPATTAPRAAEVGGAPQVHSHALDPFPKAPILPFPVEASTPAITSVVSLLVAAGVPSVLIGPDRSVKFVSDDAKRVLDVTDLPTLKTVEAKTGVTVGELSVPNTAGARIGDRTYIAALVPMSGGAGGAVLILKPVDPMNDSHRSFMAYVHEAVLGPLKALRDSLSAASERRSSDPFIADAAATLEQVLSSLELAPSIQPAASGARPIPTVTDVIRRVAERFVPVAALKHVRFDVDAQELDERFRDHEPLSEALAILMDNALHYVPGGGQVVIGLRWMEHKGQPLLLFFVIDNGPLIPESLRQSIFEPSFVYDPAASQRTGRGLFKCREFAVSHGGSVWVEAKTGKACTFFLRVRPDGRQ